MDQEKIDEYYRNVKVMADSFYGLGKMVMKRTQMDDNTVMSLLNLDLMSFLMYLCQIMMKFNLFGSIHKLICHRSTGIICYLI